MSQFRRGNCPTLLLEMTVLRPASLRMKMMMMIMMMMTISGAISKKKIAMELDQHGDGLEKPRLARW